MLNFDVTRDYIAEHHRSFYELYERCIFEIKAKPVNQHVVRDVAIKNGFTGITDAQTKQIADKIAASF